MIARVLMLVLPVLALTACREGAVTLPDAIEISEQSAGFYCQMSLLEHTGPKGQIHLEGLPAPLFFSQVKDAIAYLHMPEQSHAVVATYVQDMKDATWEQPGAWILASDAVYVLGSNALGGMGAPEFVPFSTRTSAMDFIAHAGGMARSFQDITDADVLSAPEDAPQNNVAETRDADDISRRLNALDQPKGN